MSPAPRKNTQKASPSKPTAAEVEKQASEEAAKSVPKAEDAPEKKRAGTQKASPSGTGKPRAKKADAPKAEESGTKAAAKDEPKKTPADKKPAAKKPAAKKPAKDAAADKPDADQPAQPATPARTQKASPSRTGKRDQPRKREPGEAPVVVRAQARYVRTSARKARLVCDHIRGKDVEQARAILSFTPRGAAKPWMKLLESAIANAEHNHELVGDELRIASVHADEGPTLKRYRPRAMGRATRIRKRTSHLSITLTPKE